MISGGNRIARLQTLGVGGQLALLLFLVVVLLACALPVAYLLDGRAGMLAAALAAAVCFAPSASVLLAAHRIRGPHRAMAALAIGMLLRLGLALGVCIAVYQRRGVLADSGFAFYVVVFYMITLAADTVFLVTQSDADTARTMGKMSGHGQ